LQLKKRKNNKGNGELERTNERGKYKFGRVRGAVGNKNLQGPLVLSTLGVVHPLPRDQLSSTSREEGEQWPETGKPRAEALVFTRRVRIHLMEGCWYREKGR
jgi:hypothetical protein